MIQILDEEITKTNRFLIDFFTDSYLDIYLHMFATHFHTDENKVFYS